MLNGVDFTFLFLRDNCSHISGLSSAVTAVSTVETAHGVSTQHTSHAEGSIYVVKDAAMLVVQIVWRNHVQSACAAMCGCTCYSAIASRLRDWASKLLEVSKV